MLFRSTTGNSSSGMYETWTLAFNCDYTKLYQTGGGTYSGATTYFNVAVWEPLNISTGAEGPLVQDATLGEVTSSIFAKNGYLYNLSSDSNLCACPTGGASAGAYNRLTCYNVGTGAQIFNVKTGYSYVDGFAKQPLATGRSEERRVGKECRL